MHAQPFRAAKEPVQPLTALVSLFSLRQKYSDLIAFSRHYYPGRRQRRDGRGPRLASAHLAH